MYKQLRERLEKLIEAHDYYGVEELIQDHCSPIDEEKRYDQMLDDCFEEIRIGCCTFQPSHVLKELNPTAYHCGKTDFIGNDDFLEEICGEYYEIGDIEDLADDLEEDEE